MRITKKKLDPVSKQKALSILLPQIKSIGTTANLENLLDIIFTKQEKEIILRRMFVTDLLKGGMRYREIERKLEISKITISRIKDILEKRGYGRNPNRKRKKVSYTNPEYFPPRKERKERPSLGILRGSRV